MSASSSYMKVLRIAQAFDSQSGFFGLTCPELPGLFLSGRDLPALLDDVPSVIKALYKLDCGMDVKVVMLSEEFVKSTESKPHFVPLPRAFGLQKAA